jgi:hypothetical protein
MELVFVSHGTQIHDLQPGTEVVVPKPRPAAPNKCRSQIDANNYYPSLREVIGDTSCSARGIQDTLPFA